jgi:hypothetical protein
VLGQGATRWRRSKTGYRSDHRRAHRPHRRAFRRHETGSNPLAAGGTPVDLEFAYTLSALAKLVLTAHEVYLPKPKLAVEGPGSVQAAPTFGGEEHRSRPHGDGHSDQRSRQDRLWLTVSAEIRRVLSVA